MIRWKNALLGAVLGLAFIATGASGSLHGLPEGIDIEALGQPPVCAETAAAASLVTTTGYDCGCWFFYMGTWYCYHC